jgi:hypothetical protein
MASQGAPHPYWDTRPSAAWRGTYESHAAWLAATPDRPALAHMPGWHKLLVHTDMLHCLFRNGHGNDFAASTLAELALRGCFGGDTLEAALAAAFAQFRQWVALNGTETSLLDFSRATLSWTNSVAYPCLNGKAADCKVVLAWLASVALCFATGREADGWSQACSAAAWAMAEILALLDRAGIWLTADQTARIAGLSKASFAAYAWLSREAFARAACQYKVRPKPCPHRFPNAAEATRAFPIAHADRCMLYIYIYIYS